MPAMKKSGPLHGHRPRTPDKPENLIGDFPKGTSTEQDIPKAPDRWHPIAIHMYNSVLKSRQSYYYEPSDYMVLFTSCENLSRQLKTRYVATSRETGEPVYAKVPMGPGEISSFLSACTQLGLTLAARRRLEVDIRQATTSDQDDERAVTDINEYRERLRAV